MERSRRKKGQVTIFVIVALALVLIIAGYFVVSKYFVSQGTGESFNEVYQYFDMCIERELSDSISLAGTQGGRVYVSDFAPGSEYAPFSSQYNFLGFGVPYWFYLAGNGVVREQVPTKAELQKDIAKYLNEHIGECDFSSFSEQGYVIILGDVESSVEIQESKVVANVKTGLKVEKDGSSALVSRRNIEVQSKIGLLMDEALRIYSKEKSESFLENYSVDVLRLNAPVDGTLIQCNPQMWKTSDIKSELQKSLEANLAALKFRNIPGDYFAVGYDAKVDARVFYSSNTPQVLEITGEGAGDGALIAGPVGNQEGLGILGFCYVPYHYVYDWRFPVMIQLMAGEELFQFPVVVIIDKNLPRKGIYDNLAEEDDSDFDLCFAKMQDVNIKTYDINLNPVDAEIKYSCFNQECSLGKTKDGVLDAKSPACVNGFLIVKASGFDDASVKFSSNEESSAEIILDRLYNVSVRVRVNGEESKGNALVSFDGKRTISTMLPQSSDVQLAEGYYNVSVMVYSNSTIVIPASNEQKCMEVSDSGFFGLFGGTSEKCFDVALPEVKIEYALSAGGKSDVYLLPSDLEKGILVLNVNGMKAPGSLEELQNNYAAFDAQGVEVGS